MFPVLTRFQLKLWQLGSTKFERYRVPKGRP